MKKYVSLALLSLILVLGGCGNRDAHKYDGLDKPLAELCRKIDKKSNDPELYYQRAAYYYRHGEVELGLEDMRQAVKLNDKESKYYVLFADLYFGQRETDQAEESLLKAIKLDEKNNEARLKLAELYYLDKRIEECNQVLDEALKIQNHNPKVHLLRANCLKETGDTIGYLRMLQLVIDQDPKEVKAYLELGFFYQSQENPLAITYYQNALQVEPNNKEIHKNLALMYDSMGETDKAIAEYQILLNIDPHYVPALNNLGYIFLVKKDNYDEAIRCFTQVLEIDPSLTFAALNRGIAYEYKKEFDNARADYLHVQKLDAQNEGAIKGLNRLDKQKK